MPVADSRFLSQAFVCELLATVFTTFVFVGLTVDTKKMPETYAIGYGGMQVVTEIAYGTISGGTCNPARIIGPCAVLYRVNSQVTITVLAQVIGAVIGAMLYDEVFKRGGRKASSYNDGFVHRPGDESEPLTQKQPSGGMELQANVNGGIDIDIKESKPRPGFAVDVDVDVDVEPNTAIEIDAVAEPPVLEVEINAEPPVEPEVEVEVEVEVPEVEVEVEVEPGVEVEVEVPEVAVEADAEVEVEVEVEPEVEVDVVVEE